MTAQDLAALYVSNPPALPMDGLATDAGTQQLIGQLPGYHLPVTRLDEPSSLTLALMGVATLAAYRGIWRRVVRPSVTAKAAPATRAAIKPRRRAA
jgi:hypothetical protein